MKRILLAATALSAFAATAAYAADLPPAFQPEQVVSAQSAYDWSGFYAGVNAGYGWGEVEAALTGATEDMKGGIGGAQVGYNQDFGGFVLGLEGDVQLNGLEKDLGGFTASLQYFGTVRARAGVAMDRFMPYVTGGVAFGNGKLDVPILGVSDEQSHVGWAAGAGVEYAVTDNISVKGEYLYTDLGTQTYSPNALSSADLALRFSTVRAGVNFQF
jgi:outer membrane immunogenic protein